MPQLTVEQVIYFVIGDLHKGLGTLLLFMFVNLIIRLSFKEYRKGAFAKLGKDFIAYFIFIVIANRLDDMAINDFYGWKGPTQFLTSLALVGWELKFIFKLIQKWGYNIPAILQGRVNDLDHQSGSTNTVDDINQRLEKLKNEISRLEQQANTNVSNPPGDLTGSDNNGSGSAPTI